MLEHLNPSPRPPARAVVLGAAGFVGGAAAAALRKGGVEVLGLGRRELDLLAAGAARTLARALRPDDALVVVSARAPCKDRAMLLDNLKMIDAVSAALEHSAVAHLVYVSSDAVYADGPVPLTEESCTAPESLHGVMHLAREIVLRAAAREIPLAILRPTLIYGAADPHDGYGPNRFRRLAAAGRPIVLFGEGEERRDHVLIDDVAEIVRRTVFRRSRGVLNVATGEVASFRAIAERVAALFDRPVAITGSPRQGAMPHGGYRPFDIAACRAAFPDFRYTPLAEGLARAHREAMERA